MEKKIEVCTGTDRLGGVRARLSLLVLDDGVEAFEHFHSMNIGPLDDANAIRASVEAHLAMPAAESGIPFAPWPAIPSDEWDKVIAVLGVFRTSEKVEAAATRQAERAAAAQRAQGAK